MPESEGEVPAWLFLCSDYRLSLPEQASHPTGRHCFLKTQRYCEELYKGTWWTIRPYLSFRMSLYIVFIVTLTTIWQVCRFHKPARKQNIVTLLKKRKIDIAQVMTVLQRLYHKGDENLWLWILDVSPQAKRVDITFCESGSQFKELMLADAPFILDIWWGKNGKCHILQFKYWNKR